MVRPDELLPQSENSPLKSLIVYKDDPLFGDTGFDAKADAFNHEAFANTLLSLLEKNNPPLSIGLFGAWGIGKSTIINILFDKIKRQCDRSLKPIYFNAWKYSADSFRRQFLIDVATQIYGVGHELVLRLEQLNYADVLKQDHQKNLARTIVNAIKDAFKLKFSIRAPAVARFIVGCIALFAAAAISAAISNYSYLFGSLVLSVIAPAIFIWFSNLKFEDVFVIQEAPIYDPKLIFPEQFEKEFTALINSKALDGRRVVIAIDDLDRCEPKLVQDILISTKNFIGQQNCFFIVPCDDRTIVKVFTDANQKQGYEDESLRKYFNVALRIPPITSTDLIDFANSTARQSGLLEEVVQIAVLANCRDARKMKHFLNSFMMKYQVAKTRESAHLMPQIVDSNLPELAKAVLIEDAYPDLFARIVENPRTYNLLERAALNPDDNDDELASLKLDKWSTDFPGLRDILERTRDVTMAHADVFFSLKSTNTEVRIPRGGELKTALIEGNSNLIDEIAQGITDNTAKTATADLLIDVLKRSTHLFLQNSVSGTLRLYSVAKLFTPADRRRVASAVTSALVYNDSVDILTQVPEHVLACAENSGGPRQDLIFTKYYGSIEKLDTLYPPANVTSFVKSLYEFASERKRFSDLLNSKFAGWISSGEGLTALDSLSMWHDLPTDEKIPSPDLAGRVLADTSATEGDLTNHILRRKILFENWNPKYADPFVKMLSVYVQLPQTEGGYSPELKFSLESVMTNHQLLDCPSANQLWQYLPGLYDRLKDIEGRAAITKTAVVFAVISKDVSLRTSSKEFLLRVWKLFDDPSLRESLAFVRSFESEETIQLVKGAVEQEFASMQNELQTPNDRTEKRLALCLENSALLPENAIGAFLSRTLEVQNDEALQRWLKLIATHRAMLGIEFSDGLATRSLVLAKQNADRPQRQDLLLGNFAAMLKHVTQETRRQLEKEYFSLLKDPNRNTRDSAAKILRAVRDSDSKTTEFKIVLGNTLDDLRRELSPTNLSEYRAAIEALIDHFDLFSDSQWGVVAEMAKRLLSESNPTLSEFGISLSEKIEAIPGPYQEELIHLLINVENGSTEISGRASNVLNKLASDGLLDSSRELLASRRQRSE